MKKTLTSIAAASLIILSAGCAVQPVVSEEAAPSISEVALVTVAEDAQWAVPAYDVPSVAQQVEAAPVAAETVAEVAQQVWTAAPAAPVVQAPAAPVVEAVKPVEVVTAPAAPVEATAPVITCFQDDPCYVMPESVREAKQKGFYGN